MSLNVFVCGATGIQGGNVARHLLSHSVAVNFMTRDPSSPSAKALVSLGATLCPGTYDDPSAIAAAMIGCKAVFINFMPSFTDFTEESRHAQAIVDAAKEEGIKRAVYSSSLGLEEIPKLPSWDPNNMAAAFFNSKVQITNMVKENFEEWATIRPAKFMSDFFAPRVNIIFAGLAETGIFTTALRKEDKIPIVDPNTIGAFGAAALMEPEKFKRQDVGVFDQLVTAEELVAGLGKATGRDMAVKFLSDEELDECRKKGDLFKMAQLLMRDSETYADLKKVQAWGIPLTSWDEFLGKEKERVVETYGDIV
jgi:uncharacterized protein YbjT (DUF2867 family)